MKGRGNLGGKVSPVQAPKKYMWGKYFRQL